MFNLFTILIGGLLVAISPVLAGQAGSYDGPIFDAHVHYDEWNWDKVPIQDVLSKWKAAGVTRSLVSSTPDKGTLKLLEAAPGRVVPFFRPYRKFTHKGSWYKRPELIPHTEASLDTGVYAGLGEIHVIWPEHIHTPTVHRHLEIAMDRGMYIQPHLDADALEELLKTWPGMKIIWAHAGYDASAQTVGAIMDTYPSVMADLSLRAQDLRNERGLDPAWRDLMVRHADRFMVGTDTFRDRDWFEYEALVADHRMWLSYLPRGIAEKIAYKNAYEIFGAGNF